jgi:hypothetical protein
MEMIVSVGFLPSAYAGAITLAKVVLPCLGGVIIASFLICPLSRDSMWSIMSRWKRETSKAGIISRENRESDRRVRDRRRILGVTGTPHYRKKSLRIEEIF